MVGITITRRCENASNEIVQTLLDAAQMSPR